MKRWKLLVVVVSLLTNLIPAMAMVPQPDLSGIQWKVRQEEDWETSRVDGGNNGAGTKATAPQQQPTQEQHGTGNVTPSLRNNQQPPDAQANAQRSSAKKKNHSSNSRGWKDVLGIIIAFLTLAVFIFQAFIYSRQADIMETQTGLIEEQADLMGQGLKLTQESNKTAQVAAAAATESAAVARAALKVVQRGYLTLEHWNFYRSPMDHEFPVGDKVLCRLTNKGQTPVTLVGHYGGAWLAQFVPPEYKERLEEELQGLPLSPHDGESVLVDVSFAKEEEIKRGDRKLVVFVYVKYNDAFGHPHEVANLVVYDTERQDFKRVPDPLYNYST